MTTTSDELTQILEEKGYVVNVFRDEYLSVQWSNPAMNMQQCSDYIFGRPSDEMEELLALFEEHGWRVMLEKFVPIEWGLVITTRDS
jgi:hypothetical protein